MRVNRFIINFCTIIIAAVCFSCYCESKEKWTDVRSIDNSTPFIRIAWNSGWKCPKTDCWFSEVPGLITDNMRWIEGNTKSRGRFTFHRFNQSQYTCNFSDAYNRGNTDNYGIQLEYGYAVRDAKRNSLPTTEINGNIYYILDITEWENWKELYLPYSKSMINYLFEEGQLMVSISIDNESKSQNTNSEDVPHDVRSLLEKVYPNNLDDCCGVPDEYVTKRFKHYAGTECDYDVLYNTQDSYNGGILPNPEFSKYSGYKNAYRIKWHRYEWKEEVVVVLVLTKEGGRWLIDNVITDNGRLLFDYSNSAVPFYEPESQTESVDGKDLLGTWMVITREKMKKDGGMDMWQELRDIIYFNTDGTGYSYLHYMEVTATNYIINSLKMPKVHFRWTLEGKKVILNNEELHDNHAFNLLSPYELETVGGAYKVYGKVEE